MGEPVRFEATDDMLIAGARSIGNTMGVPNHIERAKRCWEAMWAARDGTMEPLPAALADQPKGEG